MILLMLLLTPSMLLICGLFAVIGLDLLLTPHYDLELIYGAASITLSAVMFLALLGTWKWAL